MLSGVQPEHYCPSPAAAASGGALYALHSCVGGATQRQTVAAPGRAAPRSPEGEKYSPVPEFMMDENDEYAGPSDALQQRSTARRVCACVRMIVAVRRSAPAPLPSWPANPAVALLFNSAPHLGACIHSSARTDLRYATSV